jgi:hypothetical protein
VLIEALGNEGVIASSLSAYARFNARICRPLRLREEDRRKVIDYALSRLGKQYDVRQLVDLLRYLFPYPPVAVAVRRRMLALASGDPTRAICSTIIAEAFPSIGYPILPEPGGRGHAANGKPYALAPYMQREIKHIERHGLFVPRDFDVSPYFAVVKPTIVGGFDYRKFGAARVMAHSSIRRPPSPASSSAASLGRKALCRCPLERRRSRRARGGSRIFGLVPLAQGGSSLKRPGSSQCDSS